MRKSDCWYQVLFFFFFLSASVVIALEPCNVISLCSNLVCQPITCLSLGIPLHCICWGCVSHTKMLQFIYEFLSFPNLLLLHWLEVIALEAILNFSVNCILLPREEIQSIESSSWHENKAKSCEKLMFKAMYEDWKCCCAEGVKKELKTFIPHKQLHNNSAGERRRVRNGIRLVRIIFRWSAGINRNFYSQ